MIYLASPDSHPDPLIRELRIQAVCIVAAGTINAGEAVFSPIVHGHPLVQHGLPTDWVVLATDRRRPPAAVR